MPEGAKARRTYDATSRQGQARASRARVLAAARRLFLTHGYSATTIQAVARHAGVSPQSVYQSFNNKPTLLKAVFDVMIAGDDQPVRMLQRTALSRIRAEPDPRLKLHLYGQFVADTAPHHTPIQILVMAAAGTDSDAAALWDQLCAERLHGMNMFARDLAEHLRPDVTTEDARDLLWAHNSPEIYQLLVMNRSWPPEKFGRWLTASLISALLP